MPALQTTQKLADVPKQLIPRKSDIYRKTVPPISGGARSIILPHVVLSRKFSEKVTRTIFPNEIDKIAALELKI
jgi:hypothetical protein